MAGPEIVDIAREERWLYDIFAMIKKHCFYGVVEVKFENGRIVRVVKHESMMPPTRGSSQKNSS